MIRSFFALAALLSGARAVQSSTFQQLLFRVGQDTIVSSHHLRLEGPDNPASPTLWEGPLRITGGAKSCDADVSVVSGVWAAPRAGFVIVVTESGSSTYVQFIDISSCAPKWPSIKAFTEKVQFLPDRIRILPGCTCDNADTACSCSAARVYRLHDNDAPAVLENESQELTKRTLGVEFTGIREVLHPKTPQARLLPK